ncbi:MAG: 5'-nucleotidase C-terminal domain-containing protein [Ruminiclostridium sp.]|nr:5'-nucleotidase C-terminal domain-containing protein [Ruminiclostridium sp.]
MTKRLFALLLSLVMAFSLAVPAGAAEIGAENPDDLTGYTFILHTNDVHGSIDGYAAVSALKQWYQSTGADVYLMDAGDFSQGDPYVNLSQGATAVELMDLAGYDLVALGNHEFDYGYETLTSLLETAQFTTLAANVFYEGQPITPSNAVIDTANHRIGVFGLTTPETASSAHPSRIQGLTFLAREELYACAQDQVDTLTAHGCDLIVCIGHLGVDPPSEPNRSSDLLEQVEGIDLFLDGHSHHTISEIREITGSETVGDAILTSTGTKMANVGIVEISPQGDISAINLSIEALAEVLSDDVVAARAAEIKAEIDADYSTVFAQSEVTLNGEKDDIRSQETNLGNLIGDAMVWQAGLLGEPVDAAVINSGGIRATIAPGDVTKKDISAVLPYGNTLYIIQITGADLLEALEASTCYAPQAVPCFPQVSGVTFTINTGAPFATSGLYPGATYPQPDAVNRVTIHTVGGQLFDPDEYYTIATNDYMAAGGDTYYRFAASPIGYDLGIPLDEVVMDYITAGLGGIITAADYGQTDSYIRTISYSDVLASDWFSLPVTYVTLTSLMNGVGEKFLPNADLTRAMLVTTLHRMAGEPEINADNPFRDVAEDTWYTDAVLWAAETGITTGVTSDTFAPDKPLTREQMAAFFYRFADYEGEKDLGPNGDNLAGCPDRDQISEYALLPMNWAIHQGLLAGYPDNTIRPQDTATRAQIATVLMRYMVG